MRRGLASIDRRSIEWTAIATSAVLGALAVWLLARLIWILVPRGDGGDAALHVATGDAAATTTSIAKWHLFGNTPVAATASGAAVQSMILRGTLADRDPAAGVAVLDAGEASRPIAPARRSRRVSSSPASIRTTQSCCATASRRRWP